MEDGGPNAYKTTLRPNIPQSYRITARVEGEIRLVVPPLQPFQPTSTPFGYHFPHPEKYTRTSPPGQNTLSCCGGDAHTHVMNPYLIIVGKLNEAYDAELPVHLTDDVYLWTRWMRGIGLDARHTNVYIQRAQRFFCIIKNRCVLRFVIWYLTIRTCVDYVTIAKNKAAYLPTDHCKLPGEKHGVPQ